MHRSSLPAPISIIILISLMLWANTQFTIASQNADNRSDPSTGKALSLKDAIDLALAASSSVANARDALDSARSNLSLISRNIPFNPTVKVEAGANAFWSQGMSAGADTVRTDTKEITVTIQDSIATGRLLTGPSGAERLATLQVRDAERNLILSKEDVIYKTMAAYIGVLKAQKSLALMKRSLDLSEILFQDARTKLNLGVASTSDLLKAQQALDEARSNVAKAQTSLELSCLQFNQLVGFPPDASVSLIDQSDYSLSSYEIDHLIEGALTNRLEIQKARDNLTKANINLEETFKSQKPVVTISGGYAGDGFSFNMSTKNPAWDLSWQVSGQYTEGLVGEDKKQNGNGWHAGINLAWTPFDGGFSLEQEREARMQVAQAERQVHDQESQIVLSIHEAYNDLIAAQGAMQNAETSVKLAQENLKIIQLRRDKGYATDRDVSQAELALDQAVANREFAIYDCILAEARLKRAAGQSLGE